MANVAQIESATVDSIAPGGGPSPLRGRTRERIQSLLISLFAILALLLFLSRFRDGHALDEAQAELQREVGRLSVQNARLTDSLARLAEIAASPASKPILDRASAENSGATVPSAESGPADAIDLARPRTDLSKLYAQIGVDDLPRPLELPVLSNEEWDELQEAFRSLPPLREEVLLRGDPDAVLADAAWNPDGAGVVGRKNTWRSNRLVRDYRFYARVAPVERLETLIRPLLPLMRSSGAYVKIQPGDPEPPLPEEVSVTHGVLDKATGRFEWYFFWPSEHVDIYHSRHGVARATARDVRYGVGTNQWCQLVGVFGETRRRRRQRGPATRFARPPFGFRCRLPSSSSAP